MEVVRSLGAGAELGRDAVSEGISGHVFLLVRGVLLGGCHFGIPRQQESGG